MGSQDWIPLDFFVLPHTILGYQVSLVVSGSSSWSDDHWGTLEKPSSVGSSHGYQCLFDVDWPVSRPRIRRAEWSKAWRALERIWSDANWIQVGRAGYIWCTYSSASSGFELLVPSDWAVICNAKPLRIYLLADFIKRYIKQTHNY